VVLSDGRISVPLAAVVGLGRPIADGCHRGFARHRIEIRTDEAVGPACDRVDIHVVGQRHPTGVDLEDLPAARLVGDANLNLAVEAAAAPERGIDRVDAVGRADDDHLAAAVEAVHQRQ